MERSDCRRGLVVFFACAYGIAWLMWLPLVLSKRGLGLLPVQPPLAFAVSPGTLGPAIAALFTQRLFHGNWRAFRLWTFWRQIVRGAVAGSLVLLAACFVSAIAATQSG